MIIGFTGLAGSGKDSVAALLAMKGFTRYAFADEVRREAARMIREAQSITFEDLSEDTREALHFYGPDVVLALECGEIKPADVWLKPTSPLMRQLLQRHGTEFRRAQDPDYWVKKLMSEIDAAAKELIEQIFEKEDSPLEFLQAEKVVISDVRFPNEAKAIRDRGGKIWRVKRSIASGGLASVQQHVSEVGQAEIVADKEFQNDGTLYDLALKVRKAL